MRLSHDQKTILANQALFSLYSSLTLSFVIPFALVLGASNTMIGVLNALQYLAIALAQIPGARVTELLGRKVTFLMMAPLARLLWIVVLLIPYLFNNSLAVLMVFVFIINFLEYFVEPGYLSMMSDAVPKSVRGWFFAKKEQIKLFFNTILFFFAGFYLDFFPSDSAVGFSHVVLGGMIFGVLAIFVVSTIKQPNKVSKVRHHVRDYMKIKGVFRKFLYFTMSFNFAALLASPFFTVYILDNLGLSYGIFASSTVVAVVFRMLAQQHLGPITDVVGDRSVAWLMTLGTALSPLLMFFVTVDNWWWLLFVQQAISGFVWGGSDLAVFNMLLDVTNKKERAFQVSAYVFFTAAPLAIAPVLGGWIADNVVFFFAGIPLVFLLSAVLRVFASLFLLGLPELRVTKQYSMVDVIHRIVSIHPERGMKNVPRAIKEP